MYRLLVHRGLWSLIALVLVCAAPLSPVASAQTSQKLVLAYYLLAYPTYSDTVDGYKQDIRDAQALGIDGFALNAGSWSSSTETYYQTRSANMFQAALELGTGFKLFMSADLCCSLPASDVVDMVARYANHPNQLRFNKSPVFTSWMGESRGQDFWQNQVLSKLTTYNPLFIPFFYTARGGADWTKPGTENWNNPTYAEVSANYNGWWKSVVHGLQYYAGSGSAGEIAATNETMTKVLRTDDKLVMAGMTPYFWEGRLSSGEPGLLRRYYETHGGEGMATQWDSIINIQQPDFVMIDTWNDFGESYVTPADPSLMTLKNHFYNSGPLIRSHAGYAELTKYYIQRFKAGGSAAVTNDAMYYFYRTHSKDLAAPNDTQNVILYGPGYTAQPLPSTTLPTYGEVLDDIYITTVLTAPATLRVTSGGKVVQVDIAGGLQHTRVPFVAGPQSFDLIRNAATIIHKDGDSVDAAITLYNFTTTSGFGYGRPADIPLTPPTNLRMTRQQ